MEKSDFHKLDQAINEGQWNRALVSFNYEIGEKRHHIGTGFLYLFEGYTFLITANHVIKESKDCKKNVYISFSVSKDGKYIKCPITNFNFISLDEYDIALTIVIPKYHLLCEGIKSISISSFTHRSYISNFNDAFFNENMLIFGYSSIENTINLNYKNYEFYWRTLLTKTENIDGTKVNIKNAIFLEFDRKNMIELNNELDISDHKPSGNYPELKGMSGGPCLRPKNNNGILIIDNVYGLIVEILRKPPFNGKALAIAPIAPAINVIKDIVLDINNTNIIKYIVNKND